MNFGFGLMSNHHSMSLQFGGIQTTQCLAWNGR